MVQCLDGLKDLVGVLVNCCGSDLYKQPGLENPQALARETVCMSQIVLLNFLLLNVQEV